jgi:hypothetical protein
MHRLTRCLAWIGATLVVWGCSGDPTKNDGIPTDIVADPGAVFVTVGDSQAVIVTAVDEAGQSLVSDFSITSTGPGVSAFVDPNFLPTVGSRPIDRAHRIFVKALDVTSTEVVVHASVGLSRAIRVTTVAPGP